METTEHQTHDYIGHSRMWIRSLIIYFISFSGESVVLLSEAFSSPLQYFSDWRSAAVGGEEQQSCVSLQFWCQG